MHVMLAPGAKLVVAGQLTLAIEQSPDVIGFAHRGAEAANNNNLAYAMDMYREFLRKEPGCLEVRKALRELQRDLFQPAEARKERPRMKEHAHHKPLPDEVHASRLRPCAVAASTPRRHSMCSNSRVAKSRSARGALCG